MKKKSKTKPVKKAPTKSRSGKAKAPPSAACPAKLKPGAERSGVQEALQVTWLLKGKLKSAQIAYLRIGELLVQVRDKKLYAELKHADMEEYARKRLQLGRSSLFKYIQVYDWVSKFHPDWLKPKPKGFIPELSDATDLMWIENELTRTDLAPATRTALAALRKKALEGNLRQNELNPFRRKGNDNKEAIKTCLSKLRNVRMRFAELKSMPPEVISLLDAAIAILKDNKI